MSEDNTEINATDAAAALTGEPVEAPAQPAQAAGPDLTVQDLQAIKSIIDVASQRGAFKPNEMMTVGQTYNKLEQFLEAVASQQPPAAQGV
jgi:hypothetical protein|tara:strand:- start:1279 stop:1551 length:273 start_codon:yes stop_codon:yes gene_type:complete